MPPSTCLSNLFLEWEELYLQTKFLAASSSLEHLSTKKFSDRTYCIGPKIRQGGGGAGAKVDLFSDHEHGIKS